MKVIHIPCRFLPRPTGGGNVLIESLVWHLWERGVEVVAAAGEKENKSCFHQGIRVRTFARDSFSLDLRDTYGEGDPVAASNFGRILDEEQPDLVHLHLFNSISSLRLLREVKRRGIPVVFTYLEPRDSCQRGTLLRWGKEVCDGVLKLDLCTRCKLHGLGLPRGLADWVGRVPVGLGRRLGSTRLSGRVWKALRMRELVSIHHTVFKAFINETDHIVAPCDWVVELLIENKVPRSKIALCRYGLSQEVLPRTPAHSPFPLQKPLSFPIRISLRGRVHPVKGAHILIQAMRREPKLPITLDIACFSPLGSASPRLKYLQKLARGDPRITFSEPVPPGEIVELLRNYDLLAVPSQWLETGPLVALDAFAAGIPVMGSNLPGIDELVRGGANGLLVEPCYSVEAWQKVLRRLCEDRNLLPRLKAGVRPPRRMDQMAEEIETLYRQLIFRKQSTKPDSATTYSPSPLPDQYHRP